MSVRKMSEGLIVCQEDVGRNDCISGICLKEWLSGRKTFKGMKISQEDVGRTDCLSRRRWRE